MTALDAGIASRLKRDANGLFTAVAQERGTGAVLMVAWMDDIALARTLQTRKATYYSRSRGEQLLLTLDGQEAVALAEGECVEVARSPHVACLVRSPDLGYYDLLRTKLGWAR